MAQSKLPNLVPTHNYGLCLDRMDAAGARRSALALLASPYWSRTMRAFVVARHLYTTTGMKYGGHALNSQDDGPCPNGM
jgi:hypothetical protein